MRNTLLGSIAMLAVALSGCGLTSAGSEGDSIVGTWENYGYSESLQFTITTTVSLHSDSTFTVRESIKPTKESEGWIRKIIPEGTEKVAIEYRGQWEETSEEGIISFRTDKRSLYFDDEVAAGSIATDDDHFWDLTDVGERFVLTMRVLEDGKIMSVVHEGDPSQPPWYSIFFSDNKRVLFTRM